MMITLDDVPGENDNRPRITRESVFRNGYRQVDKAVESFLDEARMKAVQAQIEDLRKELQATNLERETLKQSFSTERRELQHELENVVKDKMEAQKRAIHHFKSTEEAADTLKLIKSEHAAIVEKLRKNMESLKEENAELLKELEVFQVENEQMRAESTEAQEQSKAQADELQNQVDTLKISQEGYELRLIEAQQKVQALTEELSQYQTNQAAKLDGSDSSLLDDIMEQYKRQCELVKEFEATNRILKEELTYYRNNYPDFEKVLEQKLSLQRENAQAQQLKVAYRKLQEENERLQSERKEWAQYLESSDAADQLNTPRDIIYRLAHEKQAIQESQSQVQQLKGRLEQSEARNVELGNKLEESNAKIAELQTITKRQEVEKEAAMQEKQLITIHRDMLASQVASMSKVEEEATATEDKTYPLTHRIEELESLLKEYQDQLAQTKNTLIRERAQQATAPPPSSSPFSPSGGEEKPTSDERVLELKISPANIEQQCRLEELTRLRTENKQLLDQLLSYQQDSYDNTVDIGEKRKRELGEPSSPGEQLGGHTTKIPRVTLDNMERDKEQLKSEKARLEKRLRRLSEAYGKRHQETMEQIERLLGYKLVFQEDDKIKISSGAVDSNKLVFIYSVDEHDQPKLRIAGRAKNDYMEYLRGTYNTFIHEQGNIPAFLSSVTLELMNIHAAQWDTTQETSRTYVEDDNAYGYEEGEHGQMDEGEYYEEGEEWPEEEEEYYDDDEEQQFSEEYDEMNEDGSDDQRREGPGCNLDEPITIDDDDDD